MNRQQLSEQRAVQRVDCDDARGYVGRACPGVSGDGCLLAAPGRVCFDHTVGKHGHVTRSRGSAPRPDGRHYVGGFTDEGDPALPERVG